MTLRSSTTTQRVIVFWKSKCAANVVSVFGGNKRTAYSLRHTCICTRLIKRADIDALAKNCRTSVEVIRKFYAAHIKDLPDSASINTMRPRHTRRAKKPTMQLTPINFKEAMTSG